MSFHLVYTKPSAALHMNVLIYGPPKSGKTSGAATAPGRKLLLNPDTGNATLQAHAIAGDSLHEILQPEYEEGELRWLQILREIERQLADPKQQLADTVIVDPISDLYRQMLEEQSRQAMRPSLPAYGDVSVHLERFCRKLCKCPTINAVIVCHDIVIEGSEGQDALTIPFTGTRQGSPVLGKKFEAMVDIVAYAGVNVIETEDGQKRTEYLAQLVPGKGRVAGDRFNCLGKTRKLDLTEWFSVIIESRQEKSKTQSPTAVKAA
jgi:hypothetical protein